MSTLSLYGVNIYLQPIGSVIAVFLEGAPNDVEMRFNSFYNHEATNGELEWLSDNRAMFWINPIRGKAWVKLEHAMIEAAIVEIFQSTSAEEESPEILVQATTIAQDRIKQMEWVTWHQTAIPRDLEPLALGTLSAEKPTGDITDTIIEKLTGFRFNIPVVTDKKIDELEFKATITQIL